MKSDRYRVALFMQSFAGGGSERVFLTLADGFLEEEIAVDFVVANDSGPLRDQLNSEVRVINLQRLRLLSCFKPLAKYLKEEDPNVLITALSHVNLVSLMTKKIFGLSTPIIVTEHSTMSLSFKQSPNIVRERAIPLLARWLYLSAEKVVTVSQGVADDLIKTSKVPPEKIQVIYNPINPESIAEKSRQEIDHPYFSIEGVPVIVSAGRLTHAKDFPTLIKAFAALRERMDAKLIILGEGSERSKLESLVNELGLQSSVSLPGFQSNPYPYFKNAAVFALSSVYEGFAIVIVEALACGTAVVSTDCPNGPAEILDKDHYGILVPPGDPSALADALFVQLQKTEDKGALLARAQDFSVDKIIESYQQLINSILDKD